METIQGSNEKLAIIKALSKGDYTTFEICSMLSNAENGSAKIKTMSNLGFSAKEINELFKDVASSDINAMSKIIDFFSNFKSHKLKDLEELSRNSDNSISMKSFAVLLGFSLTTFISNPITVDQAIEISLENITKRKLRGSEIFEDYYNFSIRLWSQAAMLRGANKDAMNPHSIFEKIIYKIIPEYNETVLKRKASTDYIQ